MDLSWESVLAWRLRRQLLEPAGRLDAPDIARRLCGVQAQVPSAAELAVAVRQKRPKRGEVDKALANRTLMRTWAMRGTLHLLHPADAGAYLSLLAAARTWEKGAWQRNFITTKQIAALADAVCDLVADEPRRRAMGEAARELAVANYSWPVLARRLEEIYSRVTGIGRDEARAA